MPSLQLPPEQRELMFDGTTIVSIRRGGLAVVAGDGQISLGNTVIKGPARKVRRARWQSRRRLRRQHGDAMTLFEKLEEKLSAHNGNLTRAAVELAKEWRSDKYLRRLEALLIAADRETTLVVSGTGDVVQPDEGIAAIGSGGTYALAAARALRRHTELSAAEVARRSLGIAAEICVFTNDHITLEEVGE